MTQLDFYCKNCDLDQMLPAWKQQTFDGEEYWVSRCGKCSGKVVRLIQNPLRDEYYKRSPKVKRERIKYARDLLQPGEAGFKLLYPETARKLEQAEEDYQKNLALEEKKKRELVRSVRHDINKRQVVESALKAEEKL